MRSVRQFIGYWICLATVLGAYVGVRLLAWLRFEIPDSAPLTLGPLLDALNAAIDELGDLQVTALDEGEDA
jgi:hypothetical protein